MSRAQGQRVLVAMSGGVDSSVAAAMLRREGFDVVGCFMRLGTPGEGLTPDACDADQPPARGRSLPVLPAPGVKIGHQGCCSISDAADARLVAAELGIPLYVCNFKADFGRVIDYFADEYARGRTPNPCVRCNDWLKFGKLHEYAVNMGCGFVASGHYARSGAAAGEVWLRRGLDHTKDQSYVLFGVPSERLARMLLPVGGMHKVRVRELAKEFGLPVFDKPDSQEICFVPDNDYASLVDRLRPGLARDGPIIDESGRVIGTHQGQHRFTIGQRRGLDVAVGERVFVTAKDPDSNVVRIGKREGLLAGGCLAGEANWLRAGPPGPGTRVWAKYRYNTPAAAARVTALGDGDGPTPSGRTGRFSVEFDQPQVAVAPGQAIVLYDAADPDLVMGGGWIERAAGVA
ncbi:MAG: tRNA 2-thiouridine(34) synthase MnmA [Phycisphaerales bacterium]